MIQVDRANYRAWIGRAVYGTSTAQIGRIVDVGVDPSLPASTSVRFEVHWLSGKVEWRSVFTLGDLDAEIERLRTRAERLSDQRTRTAALR